MKVIRVTNWQNYCVAQVGQFKKAIIISNAKRSMQADAVFWIWTWAHQAINTPHLREMGGRRSVDEAVCQDGTSRGHADQRTSR
jgi:hypothetical protein